MQALGNVRPLFQLLCAHVKPLSPDQHLHLRGARTAGGLGWGNDYGFWRACWPGPHPETLAAPVCGESVGDHAECDVYACILVC